MRTLILLLFLLLPGEAVRSESQQMLTCSDYEYLTRDIDSRGMDPRIVAEIKIELINATDPKCFE